MATFLTYLAIILGVIAIAQMIRVFELTRELSGSREEDVSYSENKMNATLFFVFYILFMASFAWLLVKYQDIMLPRSASLHGVETDWLFNFNMLIIGVVFVVVNFALFYFAFKYYGRGQKATFFAHSNKLELIWTLVPSAVLAIIIIYGLKTWNDITSPAPEDSMIIELYAKQFDWTARYAGKDNLLGEANVRMINGANFVGLDSADTRGFDDIIVKGEFHLPIGKDVSFKFRSQDVIHGAYMPHFRTQMNVVPGLVTSFHFTPSVTTQEMRTETGNNEFNYILLCNKICGASHYNMQMTIVVETEEEYNKWISEQTQFISSDKSAEVIEITDKLIAENK